MAETGESRVLSVSVGILGHIDSGKTSLARAISTTRSTAAFDHDPQSCQRGMTLDIGFSAFETDVPEHLKHLPLDRMQMTLVDCPGHASLVKTILVGAQIIDMMILVVDVNKGMQTQTGEGLVVAELTTKSIIVVLTKIDLLPPESREKQITKMKTRMRKFLSKTHFVDAPIVAVSANPQSANPAFDFGSSSNDMLNIEELKQAILSRVVAPAHKEKNDPLVFGVDHCFAIKGKGTVMTGTVLRGEVVVGDSVEIPSIHVTKKIKSIQRFHKNVNGVSQGDRAGLLVTQLDPTLIERDIVTQPGLLTSFRYAIVNVERIRFFNQTLKSKTKIHMSLAHRTILVRPFFFSRVVSEDEGSERSTEGELPQFSFDREYENVTELPAISAESESGKSNKRYWAFLEFDAPVFAPLGSLAIGARFETDININQCRLAFSGRLLLTLEEADKAKLRVFTEKQRSGEIDRIVDEYSLIGKNLAKKGADFSPFVNLEVELSTTGEKGIIEGTFGKSGKFRVRFASPSQRDPNATLLLRFRKYLFSSSGHRLQQR